MRTYKRKKPEYQLIDGVEKLCRLCLGTYTTSFQIFSDDPNTDVCGSLSLRIMICVGLEMTREDCLPNAICLKCFKELEKYYTFRKKCETTYQKLKSHVLAVKEREHQKLLEMKQEYEPETIIIDKLDHEEQNKHVQRLVLSINEDQDYPLVNDINSMQLSHLQELNGLTNSSIKEINLENQQNNEMQVQETSVENTLLEVNELNTPMSTILSSILVELGIMQQQNGELVLVDENLTNIELEGENNTKVLLELVEDDEETTSEHLENTCTEKTLQNQYTVKEPLKKIYSNNKHGKSKDKDGLSCATCGKRFASRSVVARHQRVHSGERPFACTTCGKRFAQREVMTRHQLVHEEMRPFACERCPKSFTQRGALIAHARRHAPGHARALALHRCPHCPKVFLYASGLSRHMMVHSGKMFVCNTCNRHFSDKSSLLRHLRKSHANSDSAANDETSETSDVNVKRVRVRQIKPKT